VSTDLLKVPKNTQFGTLFKNDSCHWNVGPGPTYEWHLLGRAFELWPRKLFWNANPKWREFFRTSLIKIQVPKEFTSKNKFKNAFALFVWPFCTVLLVPLLLQISLSHLLQYILRCSLKTHMTDSSIYNVSFFSLEVIFPQQGPPLDLLMKVTKLQSGKFNTAIEHFSETPLGLLLTANECSPKMRSEHGGLSVHRTRKNIQPPNPCIFQNYLCQTNQPFFYQGQSNQPWDVRLWQIFGYLFQAC